MRGHFINVRWPFQIHCILHNVTGNIMSTLRNKSLVKSLQEAISANTATTTVITSDTNLLKNEQELLSKSSLDLISDTRNLTVNNLKKIAKAFLILQKSNRHLMNLLKQVPFYLETKYRSKLRFLRVQLAHRNRQIKKLKSKKYYIFIVREKNTIMFYDKTVHINDNCIMVAYKLSKDPDVDRAVCISVARARFEDRVNIFPRKIVFDNSCDVDIFINDVRSLFNI